MDTITHAIVGALAGKALFAGRDVPAASAESSLLTAGSDPFARAAITACTLGAIFPDIDIFAGPIARNPLGILEWHRNITHSLVMLPIWAVLLAALSLPLARWARWKSPPLAMLVGIYALALGTHVVMDAATNFGTMIWSPLNYSRMAWDWIFILDFTFSSIALVPQLAAWCYREPGKFPVRAGVIWMVLTVGTFGVHALADAAGYGFPVWVLGATSGLIALILFGPAIRGMGFRWKRANWCRAGAVALCMYMALAAAAHHSALAITRDFALAHHLPVEAAAALPLPPTLTHWAGVITTPEGVWQTTFHFPGGTMERTRVYASAGDDRYVVEAEQLRDVQVYLWFARFPIWKVTKTEGRTIASVTDVRFYRGEQSGGSDDPPGRNRFAGVRTRGAGFSFEIVFDAAGRVIAHGFREPE